MGSERQLPLEPRMSIASGSPAFCGILCPDASITTVFPKVLAGDQDVLRLVIQCSECPLVRWRLQSWFAILFRMDVERIIDDIQQLEEIFEAPDIRPLSASDVSAANRRHDETLATSPWFRLWQHFGICCRPENPMLSETARQ